MPTDKLDVGAANIDKAVELHLQIKRDGKRYYVKVSEDNKAAVFVVLDEREPEIVDLVASDSTLGRELLGYVLRRAICRGIGTTEITETGALLVRRNGHVVVCGNSPFEHPAMAVGGRQRIGNFEGWKQYRKFFSNEAGPDSTVDRCNECGCWGLRHVRGCSQTFGEDEYNAARE